MAKDCIEVAFGAESQTIKALSPELEGVEVEMQGKRTIFGGRGSVRAALRLATIVAIRGNPVIQAFNLHLFSVGKPMKPAVTTCMYKLLVNLNAMLKTSTPWNPAFHSA